MTVVNAGGKAESHPYRIQTLLKDAWCEIESWPTPIACQAAQIALEDKYSMLLPRCECHDSLTPELVAQVAKRAKESAPGLDAWTLKEARALPVTAWQALLHIIKDRPEQLKKELLTLVKRVPLEKHEGLCKALEIRPIDLFSVILRIVSSAAYTAAKPWAHVVLHPNQYATHGGIVYALAKVAVATESALVGSRYVVAVASDFSKMFNMMSTQVAELAAGYMGLSPELLHFLVEPLRLSSYSWKLPFAAKPMEHTHDRGLPQGMAGSVMLAEICIAPLLWRCQTVLAQKVTSVNCRLR